jgi:hypothetical protein
MNFDYCTARLTHNAGAIERLAQDVSAEQARWKPAPDRWSVLEVVNHLYDEEREDFRARLDILLHRPEQPFAPIDPPRWANERKYNERDLGESLEKFLREREASLTWLKGLNTPNWEHAIAHPSGRISAGDMLASWVAHDLLHVRQLAKLHWLYLSRQVEPYKTAYAGEWTA